MVAAVLVGIFLNNITSYVCAMWTCREDLQDLCYSERHAT